MTLKEVNILDNLLDYRPHQHIQLTGKKSNIIEYEFQKYDFVIKTSSY